MFSSCRGFAACALEHVFPNLRTRLHAARRLRQRSQLLFPIQAGETNLIRARHPPPETAARTTGQRAEHVFGRQPLHQLWVAVSHCSRHFCRLIRPRRIQLFTVPSGICSLCVSPVCVRPSKNASVTLRFCTSVNVSRQVCTRAAMSPLATIMEG